MAHICSYYLNVHKYLIEQRSNLIFFLSKYRINTVYSSLISSSVNVPSGVIVGTEIVESLGRIIFNFKSRK